MVRVVVDVFFVFVVPLESVFLLLSPMTEQNYFLLLLKKYIVEITHATYINKLNLQSVLWPYIKKKSQSFNDD